MAGRPGPRSQEGMYVSSSPTSDQDPFSNAQAADGRYYDNDSDNYNRRDTYMSDSSQNGLNDDDRYYDHHGAYDPYGPQPDTDSEAEMYGAKYAPSAESLGPPRMGMSEASTPTYLDSTGAAGTREAYPSWSSERQIPLSKEEIEDIFLDLTQKFGFQRDSMRNMLLDSRASRMSPNQALLTLHADYIGGRHANYRKWYFAAQLDLDDAVGQTQNPGLQRLKSTASEKSLQSAMERWRQAMHNMSQYDRVRFVPECLCFIFNARTITTGRPSAEQDGCCAGGSIPANSVCAEGRDHDSIIGYDDVNQLFWYPEGIARIALVDKRFMQFERIDWNRAFFKTYYEKRSFGHLLVNFNRIWVIHIAMYFFYTAYNSPTLYNGANSAAMRWSATALGGAVATAIMIAATLAEFSYIPTTWNNTSHLTRRLIFLLITLALTGGPTIYVAIAEGNSPGGSLALILGIVQFFISVVATLLFAILPSGRMFGDRVAGKSRKYLASQTFTASYPGLSHTARLTSILVWVLIFGLKYTESYFFLTLSFKTPIQVMVGMKIQNCNDRYFGNALCRNQAAFTLTIMYLMDLVLFFLDTFLWWIIWNTVLSIVRSFALGLSIWTPWKDIFTRLPKRIYAKLLATADMETKYKPKVLVSQIWNAIIISMYREHLLSIDHVQKLLYHQVDVGNDERQGLKGEFFTPGSEAERRISFFAQSLTTAVPEPIPVDAMPTFTVLTPHYSEKILLSLREIIREEDQNTRVTLLEYLKQLHPVEWDNFVKDTKILAEESAIYNGTSPFGTDEKGQSKADDLPFYCIGFKSAAPEFTLRTRRDLGFGTILNFQTKIGTGMGEQMLSREYYYLGTQLPIDRFLTFYYGHPGFHIHNMLVILSVQIFITTMVYLGTLKGQLTLCEYTSSGAFIGVAGCYNLSPVFQWINRCIISIFLVFLIAYLPLFLQELVERGTWKAVIRLSKHFASLSPAFEVFSTRIYSHSIASNLTFGGARYIATGRGFATTRISFSILYSRFAGPSIYLGMRQLVMLLYVTITLWTGWVVYFWVTVLALCISPFLFNPHQFSAADFIVDYREFLRWMNRGNSRVHQNSWIGYCRLSRTMITGYKKKKLGHPSEKLSGDLPRAGWRAIMFSEVLFPIAMAILMTVAYLFVKSFKVDGLQPPSPLVRIAIVSLGPIVWNAAILLVLFMFSLFLGPLLDTPFPKFGSFMAFLAHSLGVVGMIGFFEFLWFLESWDVAHAVLGLIAVIYIQRAIHKVLISVFLSHHRVVTLEL
ncbi:1,3-beta-glucan synthase component-domain-containing protein [Fomitopsis serialis]|uniref:1,3-beta-glucan synthase component-domain-containing protein n=1 Tax=Fomitopsis serialis TaxID=139415 RepID=UPI002007CD7C|nr:1,3-beta-glucan synthase component-domain-containing protein [Neoantrodia serialis]KAH9914111.1 1,3-beta-glucan synthase component-domain-containing protein [Neoantrodia serialis]